MDRLDWVKAGASVAATIAVIWSIAWFTGRLNPESYPGELAYKPVPDMPPRVDLAAIQRGWPNNLDQPDERSRLVAYQHDMAGKAPALPPAGTAVASAAVVRPPDLGVLLAGADAGTGKAKAQVCAACHDFTAGGPDRIGPNLWGVIGRRVASRPGFAYSAAMAAQPGAWSYDRLFTYLASPARAVPGNKMGFAGLSRAEDRAAVIKYIATLGNSPPPPLPRVALKNDEVQ